MGRGAVTGERHPSHWTDVGTPDRLENLNKLIALNK
jgi:NDP-sugar pyrophosphorylase family protein